MQILQKIEESRKSNGRTTSYICTCPLPEPAIKTGEETMTAAVLNLLNNK